MGKSVIVLDVPGKRRIRRVKWIWLDSIEYDFRGKELLGEVAHDRPTWR